MKLLLTILFSLFAVAANAANWYVRPNGSTYGSSSGADWNNAVTGLGNIPWASLSPGDDVWVAGGTYTTGLVPNASGTSGNPITIRRARSDASACTSAAGWSAGFNSLVTQTSAQIAYENNKQYVVVSGRTTASGGTWSVNPSRGTQCGWLIDMSGLTQGNGIAFNAADDNMTVEYVELQGAGEINVTGDHRGIDMTPPSGTASNNTFSHLWIHDWESGAYCVGAASPIFEYLVMEDIAPLNTASFHPNGIIIWGCTGGIVRYSVFRKGPNGLGCGEGVFFEQSGGSTGWSVYGNVFAHLNYTGLKAIEVTCNVSPLNVYNNTFIDILVGSLYTSDSPGNASGNWKNNLNYQSGNNTIGTAANNMVAAASGAFVNFAGNDFHIVSTVTTDYPRDKGATLTSDGFINKDMDGSTRGADGTWDVGAYEYASGGDVTPPTLSTATIGTSGTTITLAFNETVSIGAGGSAGWALTMSGGAVTLTYSSGSGSSSLVYSLSRTVAYGETVSSGLNYTQPGNGLEDTAGNDLATLSSHAVVNNSADVTNPTLTITSPTSSPTYSQSGSAITVSGTASDNAAVTSVTAALTGATTGTPSVTGTTSWSLTASLNVGDTVITVTAHDAAGNTGTDTLTVTRTTGSGTAPVMNVKNYYQR